MTAPQPAPVRVLRIGWRSRLPLTREQFKRACLYAEAWVLGTTWKDVEDLIHATAWQIGEQLARPIHALLVGQHDIDDMPVVRIHCSEFQHHIVYRDLRLLENNTTELLLSDERIEQMVERRMEAARERENVKKTREKELVLTGGVPGKKIR